MNKKICDLYCLLYTSHLKLNVYKKNIRAVVFYQHRGFKIVNQEIDENTAEEEYTMEWHR